MAIRFSLKMALRFSLKMALRFSLKMALRFSLKMAIRFSLKMALRFSLKMAIRQYECPIHIGTSLNQYIRSIYIENIFSFFQVEVFNSDNSYIFPTVEMRENNQLSSPSNLIFWDFNLMLTHDIYRGFMASDWLKLNFQFVFRLVWSKKTEKL